MAQAPLWGSGGEDWDAQVDVYTMINVKGRRERQHSPVCVQYPKTGRFAFPGRGEAEDAVSAVGCWLRRGL